MIQKIEFWILENIYDLKIKIPPPPQPHSQQKIYDSGILWIKIENHIWIITQEILGGVGGGGGDFKNMFWNLDLKFNSGYWKTYLVFKIQKPYFRYTTFGFFFKIKF